MEFIKVNKYIIKKFWNDLKYKNNDKVNVIKVLKKTLNKLQLKQKSDGVFENKTTVFSLTSY